MSSPLHVYVWSNLDGLLFCLWPDAKDYIWQRDDIFFKLHPDSPIIQNKSRIFVAGDPSVPNLNDAQVHAVVNILTKSDDWHGEAIFYSGNEWSRQGCPDDVRGPILLRKTL